MRRFYFAILALAFAVSLGSGFASTAQAANMTTHTKATPCRDKMGKFMKCKTPMMKAAPKRCRDKMGKFTKCK